MIIFTDFAFLHPIFDSGCICTYSGRCTPRREWPYCKHWLLDIGFGGAKRGLGLEEALSWYEGMVRRLVAYKPVKILVVSPDRLMDWRATWENYLAARPWFERMYKVADVYAVLPLQQTHLVDVKVLNKLVDERTIYAIPSMRMPLDSLVRCAGRPKVCIAVIERVARLSERPIHLLGPSKPLLKLMASRYGSLAKVPWLHSFDALSYRLASNSKLRIRRDPSEPGKYMIPSDGLRAIYLMEWLKGLV